MKTKTRQQIFDACARHVMKQGTQALKTSGSSCVYLNSKGNSCAIGGPLVAAGLYTPEMDADQACVANLLDDAMSMKTGVLELGMALHLWGVKEVDLGFVSSIQACHDEVSSNQEFLPSFLHKMRVAAIDGGVDHRVLGLPR